MNGFYWIYLAMLALLFAWERSENREGKRLVYYGSWAFLLLLFALQDFSVSVDTAEYMYQYAVIPTLPLGALPGHKFELGYVLLCRLLAFLFEGDRVLLLALALLIFLPFARCYERETEDPMVAAMAFLALGMYMHAIIYWRQLAAMAILTWSHRYLRQRRLLPFLAVVLAAMSFHKTAAVFALLYPIYRLPVNRWLLGVCASLAVLLGMLGPRIIDLAIRLFYPGYAAFPTLEDNGGETLFALLWVVTLLSCWLLRGRMDDDRVRLPFLMVLTAAVIQPVCFAFYNWLRIVLYFRVALAPLTAQLFAELFRNRDNAAMVWLKKYLPRVHGWLDRAYGTRWFPAAAQACLFAVLFVWYVSELDGARYLMAPVAQP